MKRKLGLIAGALGGLCLVGATAGITYAAQTESAVNASTSDALITTSASTNVSIVPTMVESMKLPKGTWVLHADSTVVNFGPSDFARCTIFSGGGAVNAHATMVGIQGETGSQGPGTILADLSETGSVTLTSGTVIALECSHDDGNGSTPYIDTGSVLWAHRGTSVVSTSTP